MFSDTIRVRASIKSAKSALEDEGDFEIVRDGNYVEVIVPDPDRFNRADLLAAQLGGRRTGYDILYMRSLLRGAGWRAVVLGETEADTNYILNDDQKQKLFASQEEAEAALAGRVGITFYASSYMAAFSMMIQTYPSDFKSFPEGVLLTDWKGPYNTFKRILVVAANRNVLAEKIEHTIVCG